MDVKQVSVQDIQPYAKNAKAHPESQIKQVAASIKEFGFNQPIVVDKEGVIIVGHGRYLAAQLLGMETVPVLYADLSEERAKAYRLADNKLNESEWQMDIVIEELKGLSNEMIDLTGFDAKLTLDDAQNRAAVARSKLTDRFLVPPLSTLDTRRGYWQDRKRVWLDLGIQSDLGGRDKLKTSGSFSATIPGYYYFKEKKEKELGRPISHAEMEEKYLDELTQGSQLRYTESGGILSIFDPVLCEIMYRWFTPTDDAIILDPFAGGSVRGVVAGFLGYRYRGVDLSATQVQENIKQADDILKGKVESKPSWFVGDSINIDTICEGLEADMIFSCPPYFDLEVYSEDPKDLSNQEWVEFQKNYAAIITKACSLLKENRFAIFVVGEVRDKSEGGAYRNFVGETIKAFTDAGLNYYNEFILLNAFGSAALRAPRQFNGTRKMVKVHQNVLVFYKGDPKNIKEHFGKLDFSGLKDVLDQAEITPEDSEELDEE